VQIDAGPFKTWYPPPFTPHGIFSLSALNPLPPTRYQAHYGVDLGKQVAKKEGAAPAAAAADVKKSRAVLKKADAVKTRGESRVIDKVRNVLLLLKFCRRRVAASRWSRTSWLVHTSLLFSQYCPFSRVHTQTSL